MNAYMNLDRNRLLKPVKKLRKLVTKLDPQPTPGKVHDLRTNARRFEASFQALSLDARGISKSVLKDLGRCRRRAGKVRDMDVLAAYASTVHLKGEEECAVRLLEYLGIRRRKHARKLYAVVQQLGPALRRDLKRAPAILAELTRAKSDDPKGAAVAADAAATAVKLAVQLANPPRLGPKNLHPYRLKIKELFYMLQIAAGAGQRRFVSDLREVKDAIGEWHDWDELATIARESLDHGNRCGLPAELKRLARHKYEHALAVAQALRKKYLRSAHPQKNGASASSPRIPREPVWEAIAMLAA
jgi:CHAD domain-containing protein